MKRAITLLLIVLIALSCLPLAGQSSDGTMSAAIQDERIALDRTYAEIERLGVLASRKVEAKQAYESGNLAGVVRMFQQDAEPMREYLDDGQYSAALGELIDLIIVYQFVPQLEDQLLFYEGRIYYGYGQLTTARSRFEELLEVYPGSTNADEAVVLLEEIYFLTDANQALISLAAKHPDNLAPKQTFWLANAHFNLNQMEEAEAMFSSLENDPEYGFKSKALLALTSYYNFGLEYAIEKFLILILDTPEDTPDLDFVYLSLGRLYQERGDYEKALYCYDNYLNLTTHDQRDDFYYEMVLLYLQMEDYEMALGYLKELIDDPYETQYYNSPNYLSAVVNYQQGNLTDAEADINMALEDTYLMVDVLDTKRQLIQRHKDLMTEYNQSSTQNAREGVRNRINDLNDQILTSTGTLQEVSVGLTPDDVVRLQIYEEEFALVSDTIEQVRLLIDLANSRPNTKVPAQIDRWVEDLDTAAVQVRTLHYLSNLDQIGMGDYELAYSLASEINRTRMLIDTWQQVAATGSPDVRGKAQNAVQLMQENLQSLETVALYAFGELQTNSELQQTLAQETEKLEAFRNEMLQVRQQTVRDYNRQVARRLGQVNVLLLEENQDLRERYVDVLAALEQDVHDVSSRYEYTLLDILYDETLQMDEQFQELQTQYREQSTPAPAPEPVNEGETSEGVAPNAGEGE